jgi:hypothetical protein
MPRRTDDDDDDVVRDGETVRVSLMDAQRARGWAQPDNRPGGPFVQDHRPGGWAPVDRRRPLTDAEMYDAREEIAAARADYDFADSQRWKSRSGPPLRRDSEYGGGNPYNTGYGAPGRGYNKIPPGAYLSGSGAEEGGDCTINGEPGVLERQGDYLVCRPMRRDADPPPVGDRRFAVSDAALQAREQAYRDIQESDANAWRKPWR